MFNAEKVKNDCVQWIRDFFEQNGNGCNAVVGISGGKDSSVAAALCVEALGKDRVIGVLMPQGEQHDIDMAYKLVNHLNIRHFEINVKDAIEGVLNNLPKDIEITPQTVQNIPLRHWGLDGSNRRRLTAFNIRRNYYGRRNCTGR